MAACAWSVPTAQVHYGMVEAFPGQIDAISIHKPTLEDVFVHRTGRRFEETQREHATPQFVYP